ncbi:MAG TPA: SMP-30/gluconolactonase/LRE family protein, partial [Polyangiaceae bacterium]|nr:SMP-30/gluconolactonase/LRE family protein [Polyangiaceae bacterium]
MRTRYRARWSRTATAAATVSFVGLVFACGSSSNRKATTPPADAAAGPSPTGDALATYPPLNFSSIGKAVKVSDQFYFTEGPVWDPAKGVLYFTDINGDPLDGGSVGGVVYRLTPPSAIDVLFQPAGNTDGLGLDPQGNLLGAGFASRDAWRRTSDGTVSALSPCAQGGGTCYMGKEINTPDDITARSDGILYFTDPTFASGGQGFPMLNLTLGFQGVYRVTTDDMLHVEDMTSSGPNGVNLSPDEKTLYVSYTASGQVAKFDVAADGSLS